MNRRFISIKHLLLPLAAGIFFFGCGNNYPLLETVDSVDIGRYLGRWYEISHLPNRFQKGCHCSMAEYELIDSTTIRVINSCRKDSADGEQDDAKGKAFVVEGSNNSKLKVQFFWPFKGDYWILALDKENYNYAMVGTPSREYLWILSRTPALSDSIYSSLIKQAEDKGFDTSNLIITDQSCYK